MTDTITISKDEYEALINTLESVPSMLYPNEYIGMVCLDCNYSEQTSYKHDDDCITNRIKKVLDEARKHHE